MEGESKHIFTWTVENFRFCTQKNGEYFESPVFVAESLAETTWCIQLYPNGRKETTKKFVTCCLKRLENSPGPDEVECNHTMEVIDDKNKSFRSFHYTNKFDKGRSLGWEQFLNRETIFSTNTCFSRDTLNIRVTLKKGTPCTNTFSQNSCWTKIITDHFSFKIVAKNSISSCAETMSVSFSKTARFKISIEIPEDDIEISIERKKGFTQTEILICSVTLLNLIGDESDTKEAIFETDDPDKEWKFPSFLKKSKIAASKQKYLERDYFTLKFDFALSKGERKDFSCKSLNFSLTPKKDFSDSLKMDLKQAMNSQVHADIELHADEKVFRAHKVILCARSPVFMAMFNQDMVENQTGAINISDVEAETLRSLLEFMYTGDTEIMNSESALKLLLAAEKYQILSLKEKISSSLELFLSDENVCDILFTSDLIQQESLKICAVNYISENSKKIFNSEKWKQMADKNLKLATETFCEVSTH